MPYISTINDEAFSIHTGEETPHRAITIDGQSYEIDWRQVAALAPDAKGQVENGGRFSLLIGGHSYEVFARQITRPDTSGYYYEIFVAGQRFEVHVEDEREKALAGSISGAHESGEASVRAPMPGLVLGLPLEVGAQVERGQTVAILEAMKMENDLASPISGIIKEIKAVKGQTVNQGDVLVVVKGE
jgi:biotin carboxyl carrier protein